MRAASVPVADSCSAADEGDWPGAVMRVLASAAEHLEPDLLLRHLARVLADDLALVDHEDPVREREDLVELERDEQDRAALVALGDEPPVEVLDRADVEAARRLRRDEHLRVAGDLPRGDELLLVAARERAGRRERPAAAHVELVDQVPRARNEPLREEPAPTRVRRLRVVVQRDVLGERELEHEAAALPVLGDVTDARRRAHRVQTRRWSSRPATRMPPRSGARSPVSASISSVWPLPSTPAMPTISPARTSKETPRTFSMPRSSDTWRSRTSSRTSPGSAGAFSTRRSTSRPTIARARDSSVAPSRGTVSIVLPRRSTVMRSAISSTSFSLWLMKMIEMPSGAACAGSRTDPTPPAASARRSARRGSGCRRSGRAPS